MSYNDPSSLDIPENHVINYSCKFSYHDHVKFTGACLAGDTIQHVIDSIKSEWPLTDVDKHTIRMTLMLQGQRLKPESRLVDLMGLRVCLQHKMPVIFHVSFSELPKEEQEGTSNPDREDCSCVVQ